MSSVEIVCTMSDEKCMTEKNYRKSEMLDIKMFYLPELLPFDVSNIKIKGVSAIFRLT